MKQAPSTLLPLVLNHMASLTLFTSEDGSFEERKSYLVIQSLLKVQRHVANVAQFTVGRLISDIHSHTSISKNAVVCGLCNYAEKEREQQYIHLVSMCAAGGCADCAAAMQSDREGRRRVVTPCTQIQACCRLLELEFQNFTPSFFRQCVEVAVLSAYSPLVISGEPPSCVRTSLVPRAHRENQLPPILSGAFPVFPLHPDWTAIEAVQYSDGDGGYVSIECFVNLESFVKSFLDSATVRAVCLKEHGLRMIPFRELHHDAIELGHEYNLIIEGECTTMQWGYEALVSARKVLANAQKMWLVPRELDQSGDRLLLEIFTLEADEVTPKSTGVRLIEEGLSHLLQTSPSHYKEAWRRGIEKSVGIHKFGLGQLDDLHPANLKRNLPQTPVEVKFRFQDRQVTCRVENNSRATYLNEANVWILKSLLPGAGMGLFIRPTLPGRRSAVIPARQAICLYSGDVSSVATHSDYLMEVEYRGSHLYYNPSVYDGRNIGRFINQGGLLAGVKNMCIACDKRIGGSGFCQGDVHRAMEEECNTIYRITHERQLHVVTLRDLSSTSSPTELLSNYTYTYWTWYVRAYWREMGYRNPVVYGILWCYNSLNSVLCGQIDFHLPDAIRSELSEAECPYNPARRRSC